MYISIGYLIKESDFSIGLDKKKKLLYIQNYESNRTTEETGITTKAKQTERNERTY